MNLYYRYITILFVFCLLICLAACGKRADTPSVDDPAAATTPVVTSGTTTTAAPTVVTTTAAPCPNQVTAAPTTTKKPSPQTSAAEMLLVAGKPWAALPRSAVDALTACGVTEQQMCVKKSALRRMEETNLPSPKYASYSAGDTEYHFYSTDGTLTSVTFLSLLSGYTSKTKIAEETAKQRAEAIASLWIDPAKYELYFSYDAERKKYYVGYHRYIGGYETTEGVNICMYADGRLCDVAMPNVGAFDGVTLSPISQQEIDKQCAALIRRIDEEGTYKDKRFKDAVFSKVESRVIDMKNGQGLRYYRDQPDIADGTVVMQCQCKVSYPGKEYYSIVTVLVPLK